MKEAEKDTAAAEHEYHDYVGKTIPWFVRAIWIAFWCFAVYYTIRYLLPDLQIQFKLPR
jgi:hypothetical protein